MNVPPISDFIYLTDYTYSKEEVSIFKKMRNNFSKVTKMEADILVALQFDITVFTVKRFVEHFLHILFDDYCIFSKSKKETVSTVSYVSVENLVKLICSTLQK